MKKKNNIKIIIDILMLVLLVLEYSKLYTGQLIHEILGIILFILFITHNLLNINFYKGLLKGKYNLTRIIITIIDVLFVLNMFFTIVLGIPISQKVFSFLNLNGNTTIHKLHVLFGYWALVVLAIHLGLHFKMIFAKLISKIKDNKKLKFILYFIQIVCIVYGIKVFIDTNFISYLTGNASFAMPTNMILSIFNNLMIVFSISIIVYNIEKIIKGR